MRTVKILVTFEIPDDDTDPPSEIDFQAGVALSDSDYFYAVSYKTEVVS